MKKAKIRLYLVVLTFVFVALISMGNCPYKAHADEIEEVIEEEVVEPYSPDLEPKTELLSIDTLIGLLKDKYGDDYERYYNAILDEWGSAEAYLLSLTENLPDQAKQGWTDFIGFISKYSPVWGSILAVAIIVVLIVLGRKAVDGVVKKFKELKDQGKQAVTVYNKQYRALNAQSTALLQLLGQNPKFADIIKELEESIAEINKDE